MRPLDKLVPGERAYIVDMQNPRLSEELFALGIFPGDLVEVKENHRNNNTIVVSINDRLFNIYKKAAETIITHYVNFECSLN